MKNTYIYALHDPRDWAIRYVGKANDPEKRGRRHMNCARNRAMRRFVSELKSFGLSPRVSILAKCSQEQWQHWEKFWIRTVRASGAKLFNLTEGGNGWVKSPSLKTRVKLRNGRLGKKHSLESRERMSVKHLGKKHSAETRAKMHLSQLGKNTWLRGRKLSAEHREKVRIAIRRWWRKRRRENL